MPNPDWGVKRTCPTTGQRFYDLNKDPIISPYTGEVVDLNRTKASVAKKIKEKTEEKDSPLVDDEDLEVADTDADDDAAIKDEDEEETSASGPQLSDEDGSDEPVAFDDDVLLDDNEEDEEDAMGELDDVKRPGGDEN